MFISASKCCPCCTDKYVVHVLGAGSYLQCLVVIFPKSQRTWNGSRCMVEADSSSTSASMVSWLSKLLMQIYIMRKSHSHEATQQSSC